MDLIREYWWVIAILAALVLAFIMLRPKQRVTLTDSAPLRPHMQASARTAADEARASPPVQRIGAEPSDGDDLCQMKGVGPKFADALKAAGLTRYDQIAALSPDEIDSLDAQLGAFGGRIKRDRVAEQAAYLAQGDRAGFEAKFGKL